MSQPSKKKVASFDNPKKKDIKPTISKRGAERAVSNSALPYTMVTYRWMLIGVALITLGMLFMIGGSMPSPDVWDENLIYSWRRTVLAPILILAGVIIEIYAILKK